VRFCSICKGGLCGYALGKTLAFEDIGKNMARYRGALLKLFGEPYTTEGDATYEYIIEASDKTGKKWVLRAYEGSTGPAIGGNHREESIEVVAKALLQLIDETEPADFNETYYNDEYDSTITYGCKSGACYYEEKPGS
jgi:hypothetical protein